MPGAGAALQDAKPAQQRFEPDQEQYHTAQPLGRGAVFAAEHGPGLYANGGKHAGGSADQHYGGQDLHLHDCKADPDGAGMAAWTQPNHSPRVRAWRSVTLRTDSPLQMETAKASIERLTAIRIRSNSVI